MWISRREYDLINNELIYYRKRFDEERLRGDRLSDELLTSRGSLPVSEIGLERLDKQEVLAKATMDIMQKQLAEIYGDGVEEQEPEAQISLDEETAKTV